MATGTLLAIIVLVGLAAAISSSDDRPAGLRVVTHPPVGAEISVDGIVRGTGTINGLPLSPGTHRVCFGHVEDYLAPSCEDVRLTAGATRTIEVGYEPAGTLHVTVTPADLSPQIEVDGIARDAAPITIPVPVGTRQVCGGPVSGFEPLDCVEVEVTASQETSLVLDYVPAGEP